MNRFRARLLALAEQVNVCLAQQDEEEGRPHEPIVLGSSPALELTAAMKNINQRRASRNPSTRRTK